MVAVMVDVVHGTAVSFECALTATAVAARATNEAFILIVGFERGGFLGRKFQKNYYLRAVGKECN